MLGAGCGVRVLGVVWLQRFTEKQRRWCTIGLMPCAVVVAAVVWLAAVNVSLRPLLGWLVVTYTVVHRIACVNFDAGQLRLRAILLIVFAVVGSVLIGGDSIPMASPVLQLGSAVLLGVAVLNLCMALHNQGERGY
jgi:hypothetical protein